MALIAHIAPANGGRIVAKPLKAGLGKITVADGAKITIVDSETGAQVRAYAAETSEKGLLLKFATPDGEVALELSGANSNFAAMASELALLVDDAAQVDAPQPEEAGAESRADSNSDDDGDRAGLSPVLLGILGLGALGGIAAAAGSKGSAPAKDETAPALPSTLDLAAADDSGSSDSDDITKNASGLTISGTTEAGAKVELFNGATSLGTATADSSGKFTLDVTLTAGVHGITAKATDVAGNVSAASAPLSITVDTTAPTAAIALSKAALVAGETATVTITFSEPVSGFSNDDVSVGSGSLSTFVASNGGQVWTATFTPTVNVTDLTNLITLGTGYADVAGNTGTAATSANYTVDTVTFTLELTNDGQLNFGGSATGPITITLNDLDGAIFSRGGKTGDLLVDPMSAKILNLPEGSELHVIIDGAATSDTFTLNAPNAATMIFSGDGGSLSDALNIIIKSATDNPDLRALKIDTSGLTGVEAIRFVFPEDARDVVKLTADSNLSGFSTIEVSKGGVDLTAITVQPGVEFIVNSTLILTLAQFKAMSSLISVTGLGKLTINLTAEEVLADALTTFLESLADKPILIGAVVTVRDQNGDLLDLPEALDAISYPGIPELSDRVDALEDLLGNLSISNIANLTQTLAGLNSAIEALQGATGVDGELATRIGALEAQLAGIADTVVAYVDAQIAALGDRLDDLSISNVAGLSEALASHTSMIEALQAATGEDGDLATRIAALEVQFSGITDTVISYVEAQIALLQNDAVGGDGPSLDSIAGLRAAIVALLDGSDLGDPLVEGTIAYQLASLQAQIDVIAEVLAAADHIAPTVLEVGLVSAIGADNYGHLNAGDVVTATVRFSEAVLVTGSPTLLLTIGDGETPRTVEATLTGGAGTDTLTFSYTIAGEDDDFTGISIGEDALLIEGGSAITDAAGNAAVPSFAAVADNADFIIDNAALSIRARASAIFEGGDDLSDIYAGVLVNADGAMLDVITAGDFNDGVFIVPDGFSFLSMTKYFEFIIAQNSEYFEENYNQEWLESHFIESGSTVSIDSADYVLISAFDGFALINRAEFTEFLHGDISEYFLFVGEYASVDEFMDEWTVPADRLDNAVAPSSSLSSHFLEQIAGHNPADVLLTVQTPLSVAQAAALAAAGFDLAENVEYLVRDHFTTVQAALANSAQQAALHNADQVISRGDELDNIVSMTAFDWLVNLRSELGAGNDIYSSGRGDEEIVGQHGADTINLTYLDNSADTIIYESVYDGRTGNVVSLRYSADEDHYLLGTTVSVWISGRQYSYTTDADEAPQQALSNLAYVVMSKQVGDARVVIGVVYVTGDDPQLVYLDEMVNGVYTVKAGNYFLSATDYLAVLAEFGSVDLSALRLMGMRGGSTFSITSESYLAINSLYDDCVSSDDISVLQGETVLALGRSYQAFLENYEPLAFYADAALAVEEAKLYHDVTDAHADGSKLIFTGASYDKDLKIHGGADAPGEGIVNEGQPTVAEINFYEVEDGGRFAALTNGDNETQFDRELRVTVNGKTVTADIVAGDPSASVAALQAAIEAAMCSGATNAITAAYSTINLLSEMGRDTVIGSYQLTLIINGVSVDLSAAEGATLGGLMDAISAIGGVQSVELDGSNLIVTGEVRGASAASNGVSIREIQIDDNDLSAVDTAAVAGSLYGEITAVDRNGTTLTLTGVAPQGGADTPSIIIDGVEIDESGVQQVVTVNFSNDDNDYFEGGMLDVIINGETIWAYMASGEDSSHRSLLALADAINHAAGEDADLLIERAYVDGEDGDWTLYIVASVERPDALTVTGLVQSYRGEEQTATITLEDALVYAGDMGEDSYSGDRLANVYFQGGKVYATFTPRVSDGQGGLMDGDPVTISADMAVTAATSSYAIEDVAAENYIGGTGEDSFSFAINIDGEDYTKQDFINYLDGLEPALSLLNGSVFDAGETATFGNLADWLAGLDGVASVSLDVENGLIITYDAGVSGTLQAPTGRAYSESGGTPVRLSDGVVANDAGGMGDPEATAQALADAINAATTKVVQFNFTLSGEDDPLTLETALSDNDLDEKLSLHVLINGVGEEYEFAGDALDTVTTIGELINWLNEQYQGEGIWSLQQGGEGLDLRVAANADVSIEQTLALTLSDHAEWLGVPNVVAALLPFIGHAEAHGVEITVTAAEVGKDTFHIDDVRLDYEGVHQIATVTFDEFGHNGEDDINYYEGGMLSVSIDTTPGATGGIVTVHANMAGGDRQASLQNLVDEINSYTVAGDTAAQAIMPGGLILSDTLTNGGSFHTGFYVSSWSVTVGIGEDRTTYWGRGEPVTVNGVTSWVELGGQSVFANLGDFLAHLNCLDGIASAALDDDGNVVIITDAVGAAAHLAVAVDIGLDASDIGSGRYTTERFDNGSTGALNGFIGHATLGEDGTITLVSADAVHEQFTITDAALSRMPVRQEAEANFSNDGDRYYQGGKIGITVNGVTVETAMVFDAATSVYFAATLAEGHYIGWSLDLSITIGEATYGTADFVAYLEANAPELTMPTVTGFDGEDAVTFHQLINWLETLEGVGNVSLSNNRLTITYDEGVEGQITNFTGHYYPDTSTSTYLSYGIYENEGAGGNVDATLQALRDAIWQQVNHATLTIEIGDGYNLESYIGEWGISGSEGSSAESFNHGTMLGDLLDGLASLNGVASAELVNGKIVVTSIAGVAPFTLSVDYGYLFTRSSYQVGNGLYHAFSSVQVLEGDGDIYFVASDPAYGYGEIDITEVFMTLPGKEQVTTVDFGDADFANGYHDDNDNRAQLSFTINGKTITVEAKDNYGDTVRALAQATIEARDGVYAEDVVTLVAQDHAAVVRLDLPDGGDGESRLIADGSGEDSVIDIQLQFAAGGDVFAYTAPATFNMTVEELIADLNDQILVWAGVHELSNDDVGYAAYDSEANQIVFTSNATGEDAYVSVHTVLISGLWELGSDNIQYSGEDAALIYSQNAPVLGEDGPTASHIELPIVVQASSLIGDIPGIDIQVTFTVEGEDTEFVGRTDYDGYMTVAEYIAALDLQLSEAETIAGVEFGTFSMDLDNNCIEFTPASNNTLNYQIHAFNISSFIALEELTSGPMEVVNISDFGESQALTMHSDNRAISATDAISMDVVHVTFVINGDEYSGSYHPRLIETVGEASSTVGDFLTWVEDRFYGVTATIIDGDIVFAGPNLNDAQVTLELLETGGVRTGSIAGLADVLGQVDYNGEDSISFHGNGAGPDQLNIENISYDEIDSDASELQQVVIEFNNTKLDNVTNGSIISLTIAGLITRLTVSLDETPAQGELDLSGISSADHSTAILAALIERLRTDDVDQKLGTIKRGYLDIDGNFVEGTESNSVVLQIDAGGYGRNPMGTAAEIEATIINALSEGQFSVIADETRAGSVVFRDSSDGVDIYDKTGEGHGAQTGRNEQVITYHEIVGGDDSSGEYILKDVGGTGPGVTLNEDEEEEYDFLDIDDNEEIGVGPGSIYQPVVNPGDSGSSYYGNEDRSGEDGVRQTVRNPDGSYTAIDNSSANNDDNVSTGDDDLYGGAAGQYDLDGLHTDHLDGQEMVEGEDYYDVIQVGSGTNVTGGYHGEVTDSDHGEDAFYGDIIEDGFAGFTWDHVFKSTITASSGGADVINNFQVGHDVIAFEGSLEASTVVGYVSHVISYGGTGGSDFDLDRHEFGIVNAEENGIGVDNLSDAHAISQLLSESFGFYAAGEDGALNTSIFAISAEDDPTTSAIWVHTQSSYNDWTVDANELTLLAIVHTTGGTLGYDNLHMINHGFAPG